MHKIDPSLAPANNRPRRWPALLLLGLAGARAGQIWWLRDYDLQFKVENTGQVLRVLAAGLLVWWVLLSRVRWRVRFIGLAVVCLLVATFCALFQLRGVTGDRIPVIEWRWRRQITSGPSSLSGGSAAPAVSANRADFPQFLGPDRDGILSGPKLVRDWAARPPELSWRRPLGAGWAGFAVAGRDAVTLEQAGDQEAVVCLDTDTGKPRWRHAYAARYDNESSGTGPRSVPTIFDDIVVATGATGVLACLDRATGRPLWSRNILQENGAAVPDWGYSCSPLVTGDLVIVASGGAGRSLVAYRLRTGEFVWGGGDAPAGYSSPMPGSLGSARQLLIFHAHGVAGHDPVTGGLLWDWPVNPVPHVANPLVIGTDRVLVSAGYGFGAELLTVSRRADNGKWEVGRVWKSIRMKAKFTNLIPKDGFIYGLDDGMMACLSLADGAQRWKEGRYGHGQVLLVGGLLLVVTESGEVVLVDPVPEGLRELTRFRVLEGKTWNPPALAGNLLFIRHDREAACFRLPTE